MIEEVQRPNPKSRGERTRRRLRLLNSEKNGKVQAVSPISISPPKTLIQLENQRNNNMKSSTLPPNVRKSSLKRLLSFGKKKKDVPADTSKSEGSRVTLTDVVEVATAEFQYLKKKRDCVQTVLSCGTEASQESLCEVLEVDSPSPAPQLRNVLRASSVIELAIDSKKLTPHTAEDDSTDSFKSADSPVLCNTTEEPAVDSSRQGWPDSDVFDKCLTESAFTVFAESQFVKDLSVKKEKKKPAWKRLLSREKVFVYSKTQSDLLSIDVDGGSDMSQNTGAIRKDRVRGRGTGSGRKSDKVEKNDTQEKSLTPSPDSPPASTSRTPPPLTPLQKSPEEELLPKQTAVGPQIIEEKNKEGQRVSGEDLRKQLTEGLKNGSGKSKDANIKALLSEITQGADKTSAAETQNFLESERKKKEDEKEEPKSIAGENLKQSADSSEISGSQSENLGPSTSQQSQEKPATPPTESKKEHLYKILVIGELGTGKTSIIKRYVHQFFSQHYRATIGVDFALKVLNWDDNSIIRLQLWDIAGQERFGNMTRVYYKEAVGAFIVFDVTRAATFDAVNKWKQDLDSKVQLSDGSPIPCILLANKCDQPKEGVVNNKGKMDEYCRENGFAGWFETSAKENINIEDAAKSLVLKILQNDKLIRTGERNQDNDKIALDGTSEYSGGKSCRC